MEKVNESEMVKCSDIDKCTEEFIKDGLTKYVRIFDESIDELRLAEFGCNNEQDLKDMILSNGRITNKTILKGTDKLICPVCSSVNKLKHKLEDVEIAGRENNLKRSLIKCESCNSKWDEFEIDMNDNGIKITLYKRI